MRRGVGGRESDGEGGGGGGEGGREQREQRMKKRRIQLLIDFKSNKLERMKTLSENKPYFRGKTMYLMALCSIWGQNIGKQVSRED